MSREKQVTKGNKGITLIALIITIIVMLILVAVTINVTLNGGLFDKTKQAVAGMDMATIKEIAQMVNAEMIIEEKAGSGVISKQVYISKLQEALGERCERIKYGDTNTDVLLIDGKYALSVENTDFDVEVKEYKGIIDANQLVTIPYDIEYNVVIDEKPLEVTIKLDLQAVMSQSDYETRNENLEEQPSFELMEQAVISMWNDEASGLFEQAGAAPITITSINDYTALMLNYDEELDEVVVDENGERIRYNTLEEWLAEPKLLALINESNETNLTQDELTAELLNSMMHGYEDYEEYITQIYNDIQKDKDDVYTSEYFSNTQNLRFYMNSSEIEPSLNATEQRTNIWEKKLIKMEHMNLL